MNDRVRELECVISDLKQQSRDAEKVRDELLGALRLISTARSRDFGIDYAKGCADAAIARATGEQP